MAFRAIFVAFLIMCFGLVADPAHAMTPLGVSNLGYDECPAEYAEGIVDAGSLGKATCYLVTGTLTNNSGKPILNADIFGRIYDKNNNPVMQNRGRLGGVDYVPPGESDFEIRVSVAANQPPPLKLKNFKASGFVGKVRRQGRMD
ncbi:MAG: FxLYD domain-containing protein [Cyanobacteria bacterium P01_F01_bin.13]